MARLSKQLYPWRDAATMRPAATLIFLRDSAQGLQVLMTRRSATASFAPGVYVFPGGVVDDEDRELAQLAANAALHTTPGQSSLVSKRLDQDANELAWAIAACREATEELGIVLARFNAEQTYVSPQTIDRDKPLGIQLQSLQAHWAADQVYSFSHWQTDQDMPRRFDVRFMVAKIPSDQIAIADEGEQFEPEWIVPSQGLTRFERGEFNIIFPTIRTLKSLANFSCADDVIAHCKAQLSLPFFLPRAGYLRGQDSRHTADEMQYGELQLVCPDGQIQHHLDWQTDRPVPLLKHIQRLTCPNPGVMTGPGTNTYIIGEGNQFVVIDPGPDDKEHIERIAAIVGPHLTHILCTHSHPDHHPGAKRLQALCTANNTAMAPIMGLPMPYAYKQNNGKQRDTQYETPNNWHFDPDVVLHDGQCVRVGDSTLRAIHTPGHASNHLCFLLEEDQLLFSGDHILNGVTPIINPPDGDMQAYLDSLNHLASFDFDFIFPAHGYVLAPAKLAIEKLIAHRLKREAKVVAAIAKVGDSDLDVLVAAVYDDVDVKLHPAAKRSLLAHLIKLKTV